MGQQLRPAGVTAPKRPVSFTPAAGRAGSEARLGPHRDAHGNGGRLWVSLTLCFSKLLGPLLTMSVPRPTSHTYWDRKSAGGLYNFNSLSR